MSRKRNESRSIISAEGAAAASATHRRSLRASVTPAVSAQVAPQSATAETALAPVSEQEEIATLAYLYWEARGCQGGSPEEDWLRAEQEVRRRRTNVE
jgi:hypothetical protein